MTDKKPEISPAVPAVAPASGSGSGSGIPPGPSQTKPKSDVQKRKSDSVLVAAFIIALLLAIALGATVWYQHQQHQRSIALLQEQVRSAAATAGQGSDEARQALALAQEQSSRVSALQTSLNDAVEQAQGLQQAFQTLTDSGSDLVLINDIDHLVTIAQQQLQLGGNVANAIISLETAQAQLARANRPALASLQQTINGDLNRLRATSTIDIASLSEQLDELGSLVSQAPLMVPDDAAPEPVLSEEGAARTQAEGSAPPVQDPDAPWWKQGFHTMQRWTHDAWSSVRADLGQFIAVRRVDDAQALLMSPDQATRFRENLRLRIMTAQLALMMRQPKVWSTETASLVKAIESRFDQQSPEARRALKIARDMSDTDIDSPLPTVDNSLAAIESLRDASAKSAKEGPAASQPSSQTQRPADQDAPAPKPDAESAETAPASKPTSESNEGAAASTPPSTPDGNAAAPQRPSTPSGDGSAPTPDSGSPGASAPQPQSQPESESGKNTPTPSTGGDLQPAPQSGDAQTSAEEPAAAQKG